MKHLSTKRAWRRAVIGLAVGALLAVARADSGAAKDWSELTLAVASTAGDAASTGDRAFGGFERSSRRSSAAAWRPIAPSSTRIATASCAGLLAGTADAAMAALPVTPTLTAIVGFTEAYAEPRHGFALARSGSLLDLPGTSKSLSFKITPGDAQAALDALRQVLRGRRIGAETGTADLRFLETYLADVATVSGYPTSDAAARDLLQGRLDAIMAPTIELAVVGERPGFQALVRAGPEFGQDDLFGDGIAVALRKSESGSARQVQPGDRQHDRRWIAAGAFLALVRDRHHAASLQLQAVLTLAASPGAASRGRSIHRQMAGRLVVRRRSTRRGSSMRQRSWARGQRVWNRQPEDGRRGLGTSPASAILAWRLTGSIIRIRAEIIACGYRDEQGLPNSRAGGPSR